MPPSSGLCVILLEMQRHRCLSQCAVLFFSDVGLECEQLLCAHVAVMLHVAHWVRTELTLSPPPGATFLC